MPSVTNKNETEALTLRIAAQLAARWEGGARSRLPNKAKANPPQHKCNKCELTDNIQSFWHWHTNGSSNEKEISHSR